MDNKYYDVVFTLLEMIKEQRSENNWKDLVIRDKDNEIRDLKSRLEDKKGLR